MEIEFNYMVLEKLELVAIDKKNIYGILNFRDDSNCKFFKNDIILRNIEENRVVNKYCEMKKKCNIVIDAFSRTILKITSIDEDKTIYAFNLDLEDS